MLRKKWRLNSLLLPSRCNQAPMHWAMTPQAPGLEGAAINVAMVVLTETTPIYHRDSRPAAGRGVDNHASADRNANAGSVERRTMDPHRYCELCNLTSHRTRDCRKLQQINANAAKVSFSTHAHDCARAVYTADTESEFLSSAANTDLHATSSHDADTALHTQTDCLTDTSALLANIWLTATLWCHA